MAISGGISLSALRHPYLDHLQFLGGNVATCDDIQRLIDEAEQVKINLKSNDVVEELIRSTLTHRDSLRSLKAELSARREELNFDEAIKKATVALAIVCGAIGLLSASPIVVGAAVGFGLVGGSALTGIQLVYGKSNTPTILAGHFKDRVVVLAEPTASQIGSSGGKIVGKSLIIADLVVNLTLLYKTRTTSAGVAQQIQLLETELGELDHFLSRYPKGARGPWRAIFQTNIQGAIDQLTNFKEQFAETNCRDVGISIGPTMKSLP